MLSWYPLKATDEALGIIKLRVARGIEPVILKVAHYDNGRPAIVAFCADDGARWGDVTVNLPDEPLGPDEVFVKTWSENEPWIKQLLEVPDLFEDTGRRVQTGFVEASVWKIKGKIHGTPGEGATGGPQPNRPAIGDAEEIVERELKKYPRVAEFLDKARARLQAAPPSVLPRYRRPNRPGVGDAERIVGRSFARSQTHPLRTGADVLREAVDMLVPPIPRDECYAVVTDSDEDGLVVELRHGKEAAIACAVRAVMNLLPFDEEERTEKTIREAFLVNNRVGSEHNDNSDWDVTIAIVQTFEEPMA